MTLQYERGARAMDPTFSLVSYRSTPSINFMNLST